MGLVTPWVTPSDVKLRPSMDDIDDVLITRACGEASDLMYALSGRKFPGARTVTVRPAARPFDWGARRWSEQLATWGWPLGYSLTWGSCATAHNDFSGSCDDRREIDLLRSPVRAITEVKIDGAAVEPSAYRIDGYQTLVRIDGGVWPTCQIPWKGDDQPGTFSVTFTYGVDPPSDGKEACATLAAELAKYHADRPNKLPTRLTSLTRQGVSMTVLDPMQFLQKPGMPLTGIWEIDLFVRTHNPNGRQAPPVVMSPDRPSPRIAGTIYPPRED